MAGGRGHVPTPTCSPLFGGEVGVETAARGELRAPGRANTGAGGGYAWPSRSTEDCPGPPKHEGFDPSV